MKASAARTLDPLTTAPAAAAAKGLKAARDFESILLTSVFDALEKAFSLETDGSMPGASDYRLMATRALAQAVSTDGGIGIAKFIVRHLPVTKVQGKD